MKNLASDSRKNVHRPLNRTSLLLVRLRASMEAAWGRSFTYEEISGLSGEAVSTLSRWFNGSGHPPVELILRMLEYLPSSERGSLLNEHQFCRVLPSLGHPRLGHDPTGVSYLRTLLSQDRGITLVRGSKDAVVTFVVSALGHSIRSVRRADCRAGGIDIHEPDWFVPVPEVTYLHNVIELPQLKLMVNQLWERIASEHFELLILNGIWGRLPGLTSTICKMAGRCHVVITEEIGLKAIEATKVPAPAHVVSVSQEHPLSELIHLQIEAA